MLRSNFCDYSDVYVAIKGTIDLLTAAANKNVQAEENVVFKK